MPVHRSSGRSRLRLRLRAVGRHQDRATVTTSIGNGCWAGLYCWHHHLYTRRVGSMPLARLNMDASSLRSNRLMHLFLR